MSLKERKKRPRCPDTTIHATQSDCGIYYVAGMMRCYHYMVKMLAVYFAHYTLSTHVASRRSIFYHIFKYFSLKKSPQIVTLKTPILFWFSVH